jgi:hypothetical protein
MKKKLLFSIFALLIFLWPGLVFEVGAVMTSDGGYQIWADTVSVGGGEDPDSGNYTIDDTLGEQGVGDLSSGNYTAGIGFRKMTRGTLTFSVSPSSLAFGELSTDSAKSASHEMTIESDSSTGVSVTFSGSTLTCSSCSGTNTVSPIGDSAQTSSVGSSQFGFNVIYSSGGAPVAEAQAPYNTSGQYAFSSGDEIVSSAGAINETVFNVNYIANISGNESEGSYATAITYTAAANL